MQKAGWSYFIPSKFLYDNISWLANVECLKLVIQTQILSRFLFKERVKLKSSFMPFYSQNSKFLMARGRSWLNKAFLVLFITVGSFTWWNWFAPYTYTHGVLGFFAHHYYALVHLALTLEKTVWFQGSWNYNARVYPTCHTVNDFTIHICSNSFWIIRCRILYILWDLCFLSPYWYQPQTLEQICKNEEL